VRRTRNRQKLEERQGQADFRAAHRLALQLMPADGDLSALVDRLADHRGRPIIVETTQGASLSGQTLALEAVDRISLLEAPPGQIHQALCHELAHLLLGHLDEDSDNPLDLALAQLTDIDPATIRKFLTRHAYDTPQEAAAERLATVLRAESDRRARKAQQRSDPRADRLI
jgi:hypothetical protein